TNPLIKLVVIEDDITNPYIVKIGTSSDTSILKISTSGIVTVGDETFLSDDAVLHSGAVAKDFAFGTQDMKIAIMGTVIGEGTGSEDGLVAGNFEVHFDGNETAKDAMGIRTSIKRTVAGGGILSNATGLLIDELVNDGIITETFGIFISTLTSGNQTEPPYAIYSEDPKAATFLAGSLGINEEDATAMLHISTPVSSNYVFKVSTVITINAYGDVSANKYYGDGSGLTNISVSGDNLGSHIATETLKMGIYDIQSSTAINAGYYQINGSTVVAILPGIGSLAIGLNAGRINTGVRNSFMGYQAGYSHANGLENTFVGYTAGYSDTGGRYNTFMGSMAGSSNETAMHNSFIGYAAGNANTKGEHNSFVGSAAGNKNTTGAYNSIMGSYAGLQNKTGSANVIFGNRAGGSGSSDGNSFSSSTIIGYQSGYNLETGSADNIFLGFKAGYNVTTGSGNIIIGYEEDALTSDASGYLNIGGIITGDIATGAMDFGAHSGIHISSGGAITTRGIGHGITAGGIRGMGAVDLQAIRNFVDEVASGDYSVLGGGRENKATTSYAMISGGYMNTVSSYAATVAGGVNNMVNGQYGVIGGGLNN
ncbi:MAG: hypothetical protein KAI33_00040, partial [Elusimicrobiales bacterium]|nr:hypothetical protein [Elusimicrobiales bacterium]